MGFFVAFVLVFLASNSLFAQDYSVDEYMRRSTEMNALDAVRDEAEPGSDAWSNATENVLQARIDMVGFIDSWLASGSMPAEFVPGAMQARWILLQNVVSLYVELEQCEEAELTGVLLQPIENADAEELARAYQVAMRDIEACGGSDDAVATADPEVVPDGDADGEIVEGDPEVVDGSDMQGESVDEGAPTERSGNGLAIGLIAGGGALFASGWIWDAANVSMRNEFDSLSSDCSGPDATSACGPNVQDRLVDLQGKIDSAKVPVAVLVGAGGAIALTGVILLVTGNGSESADASGTDEARRGTRTTRLSPAFGPRQIGMNLEVRW